MLQSWGTTKAKLAVLNAKTVPGGMSTMKKENKRRTDSWTRLQMQNTQ